MNSWTVSDMDVVYYDIAMETNTLENLKTTSWRASVCSFMLPAWTARSGQRNIDMKAHLRKENVTDEDYTLLPRMILIQECLKIMFIMVSCADKMTGVGCITFIDESVLFAGEGTLRTHQGDIIEGSWYKGRASGKHNTVKFKNGDTYTGGMKSGLFHGEGVFQWRRNMGSYKGTWFKGRPQGRGVRVFINGNIFTGNFEGGRINGDGVMSYSNGM